MRVSQNETRIHKQRNSLINHQNATTLSITTLYIHIFLLAHYQVQSTLQLIKIKHCRVQKLIMKLGFPSSILLVAVASSCIAKSSSFLQSCHLPSFCKEAGINTMSSVVALNMSNSEESNAGLPKKSRLGGNSREPTIQELSIMDDMITKLMKAKPYELPNAVSKAIRVVSSPRFFIRIAERADIATDKVEKEQLSALADNLVSTIEAVVSSAEDKLEDRAKLVERVVKAAAEPDSGEFLVPLSLERLQSMRNTMSAIDPNDLDEGFLSTVDAWMNKSSQDGLDGMIVILQKVLQMYAGTAILKAKQELQVNVGAAVAGESQAKADQVAAEQEAQGPKPAAVILEKLLTIDTDAWDAQIRQAFTEGEIAPKSLIGETQRVIEAVVLGLENGSMAQRVQAEYLKELVTRIETIEKQL